MKLNQKGFGAVEGLLVIIALTLIVGVGFYVVNTKKDKNTNNTTKSSETVSKNKATQESDKQKAELQSNGKTLASLEIPKDWKVTVAHKSRTFGDGPACSLIATNSLSSLDYGQTTFPGAPEDNSTNGVVDFDIAKQPSSKDLEQYFVDDLYGGTDSGTHSFDKLTINGNPAVVYNGSGGSDSNGYKQQYYLVSNNGNVACLRWRYADKGFTSSTVSYDYSKYLPDVEAIAKSIKFAN